MGQGAVAGTLSTVALVLTVALGAFLVGRLAGGTLPRLLSVRPRSARLLAVAVALQVVGWLVAALVSPAYGIATALSGIFVGLFGMRNRALPGVPLVAAGLLCNVAVVVANGAMPVSLDAAQRAGVARASQNLAEDPRHEPLTPGTRMSPLSEVIPVALPPHREVASPGDVMLAAGIALFVVTGMNRPRRRARAGAHRSRAPAPSGQDAGDAYATM